MYTNVHQRQTASARAEVMIPAVLMG